MEFSVLVPVYNVEKYLTKCLVSLERQTFKDFEVILVDDGSKDNSGKICDKFCEENSNMKVIHKKNEGLISARRIALEMSSGDYCVFCDSDDFLEKNALEELHNVISSKNPDLIIYNAYLYQNKKKETFFKDVFEEGIIRDKQEIYVKLLTEYAINSLCIKAVKRDIVDVYKDYSMYYGYNYGEDLLQTIPLIISSSTIYYHNKELYDYRVCSGMMRKYNDKYFRSYKLVNDSIAQQMASLDIPHLEEMLAYHLMVAAYGATTQIQYSDDVNFADLHEIKNDKLFIKYFDILVRSDLWHKLSIKERTIFRLLDNGSFHFIYFILKIKTILAGNKNE